ncbi:hypothetical protein PR002_g1893 [Phytophthora rubi]|nr:hypothetical protein PR002_g1893 [Phytophthora rubi]
MNAYQWMDWIVMEHHELSFCEKKRTRKYTSLHPITRVQLRHYLDATEPAVQARIRQRLAGKPFGFLIDAWTGAGTHFAAIIAVTPSLSDGSTAEKFLLVFSPFVDEADMGADSLIDLLDYAMDVYGLTLDLLMFYVCDHASVNGALSSRTDVPMIGCASHRLQLAVRWLLEPEANQRVIQKVHDLMTRLSTLKHRHALRQAGALMPVVNNTTRWSSTYDMIDRYFDIAELIDNSNPKLLDVLLTPREEVKLKVIFDWMKNFESVSKRLQAGGVGEKEASLLDVRRLFDAVIKDFPITAKYLSATASTVVKSPHFEAGVVKVLSGKERKLKPSEITALSRLENYNNGGEVNNDEPLSFAERVLRQSTTQPPSRYIDLRWIPSTSNEVERLFSRAGLVFSVYRRAMHPTTLETLLFLVYNRDLWDPQLVAAGVRQVGRRTRQRV